MDKQPSADKSVRQRRLRRRKFILAIWGFIKSFFKWLEWITFKKGIIISVLLFIAAFVHYLAENYELYGMPFPIEVANTIITVAVGQLALTAISSIGSRAVEWAENKYNTHMGKTETEDKNYG